MMGNYSTKSPSANICSTIPSSACICLTTSPSTCTPRVDTPYMHVVGVCHDFPKQGWYFVEIFLSKGAFSQMSLNKGAFFQNLPEKGWCLNKTIIQNGQRSYTKSSTIGFGPK